MSHSQNILNRTQNFLDLTVYAAGIWKTPRVFHYWAAVSLLAALVEDRITLDIFDHEPLKPNVWVFLIGGTGVGKDHAMGHVLSLIDDERDALVKIDGKVTIPALYDFLAATQRRTTKEAVPFYLVSSDLGEQLPPGPEAKDFTSRVLNLYGGRSRPIVDLTRTNGKASFKNPVMNWMAGVTPDWFPEAIDSNIFHSGFAGRAFFVFGEPDWSQAHRIRPFRPPDKDRIMEYLRQRVEMYLQLETIAQLDAHATQILNQWLMHTAELAQSGHLADVERKIIGRMKTSAEKLAMLYALADFTGDGLLMIQGTHMQTALLTVEELSKATVRLADTAYVTKDTRPYEVVKDMIRSAAGPVLRSTLIRKGLGRGVRGTRHMDEVLDGLREAGFITMIRGRRPGQETGRGGIYVEWTHGRVPMRMINGASEEAADPEESLSGTDHSQNEES